MPTNDLIDWMEDATRQMQSHYNRIQKRAREDPGTAGANGEENWAALLRDWLPANYHVVTQGRIMNTDGECGPQVDVLILSPAYPKVLLNKKEYLEAGVLAAFECKITLKAEDIRKTVRNAAAIRRLSSPTRTGTPREELNGQVIYGLLAHSHGWKSGPINSIEKIETILEEAELEYVKHPNEILDLICVSNLATWSCVKHSMFGDLFQSTMRMIHNKPDELQSTLNEKGKIRTGHFCFSEFNKQIQDDFRSKYDMYLFQSTEEADANMGKINLGSFALVRERSKKFHVPLTPIGSFLTELLVKLAWQDANLRPISGVFSSNLLSNGQCKLRSWPLGILSEELLEKVTSGRKSSVTDTWDEWSTIS